MSDQAVEMICKTVMDLYLGSITVVITAVVVYAMFGAFDEGPKK